MDEKQASKLGSFVPLLSDVSYSLPSTIPVVLGRDSGRWRVACLLYGYAIDLLRSDRHQCGVRKSPLIFSPLSPLSHSLSASRGGQRAQTPYLNGMKRHGHDRGGRRRKRSDPQSSIR